jgi:hypothetical protein
MMDLGPLWSELESATAPSGDGLVRRRLEVPAAVDVFLAVSRPDRVRSLLITLPASTGTLPSDLPQARGIRLTSTREGDRLTVQMLLGDTRFAALFTVLTSDVVGALLDAGGAAAALDVFVSRFRRWQRFLEASGPDGLGWERQRGLFGELWFLRNELVGPLGLRPAVVAWMGPTGAMQDFQFTNSAVEVKTTGAGQPQLLRVTNERQLDPPDDVALFLFHLSVDVRQSAGETLVDMVGSVRGLAAGSSAENLLEERLLEAGYLDIHASQYALMGYTRRGSSLYRVEEGFPRIRERDLLPGVGRVNYSITASECAHYAAPLAALRAAIVESRRD